MVKTLPLWNSLPHEAMSGVSLDRRSRPVLWLAFCFPKLALEVLQPNIYSRVAIVIEETHAETVVHTASPPAEALGIHPGMPLTTAYTLYSGIEVHLLDKSARQQRLEQLAAWAGRFSSRMSLHPPCSFMLEAGSGIKYCGSLTAVQKKITEGLSNEWKHLFYQAITPTAAASLMLAESGHHYRYNTSPSPAFNS